MELFNINPEALLEIEKQKLLLLQGKKYRILIQTQEAETPEEMHQEIKLLNKWKKKKGNFGR